MKILMLLSRCDQTGMTTHTLDLAQALTEQNVDVKVLIGFSNKKATPTEKDLLNKFKSILGCKISTYPRPYKNSKFVKIISSLSLISKLIFLNYDLIHVQSPYLSWVPALLKKKFVSTMHVTDIRPRKYYKNATHLIAISNETKEFSIETHGYKEEDITIVNHGVSPNFSQLFSNDEIVRKRKELGLPTDKILILLVGSIEPRKGHDILLKSVSNLPKEIIDKLHIVFLGSDKTDSQKNLLWLNQEIEKSGLTKFVSRFEYQPSDLFYKISDIFILPSWQEGFPLVTIEAMLGNCLCIRSDAEGAYEQIQNGTTGYIFPKGDVNSLTEILNNVIKDEDLRTKIAEDGRNYALNNFLSSNMAKNTLKVYEKVISKK